MKKVSYVLTLVLLIVLTACGNGGYKNVSSQEAKQLIDDKKAAVLDVRSPVEFQQGHIPNAKLIPVEELDARLGELEKGTTYLVVCRSGHRSAQASEILADKGFNDIYNMTGGMNTWAYGIEK